MATLLDQPPSTAEQDLREIHEIQSEILAQAEKERAAAVQASEAANEHWRHDFDARVNAGLIDPEKFAKYLALLKKGYPPERTGPPAVPDPAERFHRFAADLIRLKQQPISMAQLLSNWGNYFTSPMYSWGTASPQDKYDQYNVASSEVAGNSAKLLASALGEYPYDTFSGKAVFKGVTIHYSEADGFFVYEIPVACLPYAGKVRISSTWNISGEYTFSYMPWDGMPNWQANVELKTQLIAYPDAGSKAGAACASLVTKAPGSNGFWECEKDKPFQFNAVISPQVDVDIAAATTKVTVFAGIRALCSAGGLNGAIWANYARLQASAEIVELRCFTLYAEQPPVKKLGHPHYQPLG